MSAIPAGGFSSRHLTIAFCAACTTALGRFIPLSAQEYVLAAKQFGPSMLLFHAIPVAVQ